MRDAPTDAGITLSRGEKHENRCGAELIKRLASYEATRAKITQRRFDPISLYQSRKADELQWHTSRRPQFGSVHATRWPHKQSVYSVPQTLAR